MKSNILLIISVVSAIASAVFFGPYIYENGEILKTAAVGYVEKKVDRVINPPIYGAVVRLVNAEGETECTGFVVSKIHVVTAGHCALSLDVSVVDENLTISVPSKFSYISPFYASMLDVAVLTGDYSKFNVLEMDMRIDVAVGTEVESIGYALGGALHSSRGKITAFENFFIATTGINLIKGMSGGPIIDKKSGKVIGVNSRIKDDSQYFTSTINLDALMDVQ